MSVPTCARIMARADGGFQRAGRGDGVGRALCLRCIGTGGVRVSACGLAIRAASSGRRQRGSLGAERRARAEAVGVQAAWSAGVAHPAVSAGLSTFSALTEFAAVPPARARGRMAPEWRRQQCPSSVAPRSLRRQPAMLGAEAALRAGLRSCGTRRRSCPRQTDVHMPHAPVVVSLEARKGCQQPRQHGNIGM